MNEIKYDLVDHNQYYRVKRPPSQSPDKKEAAEVKEVAMWRSGTDGRFANALKRKSRKLDLDNVEAVKRMHERQAE